MFNADPFAPDYSFSEQNPAGPYSEPELTGELVWGDDDIPDPEFFGDADSQAMIDRLLDEDAESYLGGEVTPF